MAVSKAQICNLALAHIKQTKTTIANLDTDTSSTAVLCRVHYDVARRFVLANFDWNFAGRRVALADIGSPSALWAYRYDLPPGSLKVREIEGISRTDAPTPFTIELVADGSKLSILTDKASAVAAYTWDVENPDLFSPAFTLALSWYLASELAPALSGSKTIQQSAVNIYQRLLAAAQSEDSREGEADPIADSPWDAART
jgi:hypothetical protein